MITARSVDAAECSFFVGIKIIRHNWRKQSTVLTEFRLYIYPMFKLDATQRIGQGPQQEVYVGIMRGMT